MKDPLDVSPRKGNQGTTRGKELKNSFDLGGNRAHDLRIRSTVTVTKNYVIEFQTIPLYYLSSELKNFF